MKPDVLPDEIWKPAPGEKGLRHTIYGYYHPGKGGLFNIPAPADREGTVVVTGAAGIEFLRKEGLK